MLEISSESGEELEDKHEEPQPKFEDVMEWLEKLATNQPSKDEQMKKMQDDFNALDEKEQKEIIDKLNTEAFSEKDKKILLPWDEGFTGE